MIRNNRPGLSATAVLANGISRHHYDYNLTRAVEDAFAPVREANARQIEHVGSSWSPAQHTRRVA